MDRKDPQKFFDEWLNAYSDHLHMIRQGMHVDIVEPKKKSSLPPTKKTSEPHKHKPADA
jgi:hypothetical protein